MTTHSEMPQQSSGPGRSFRRLFSSDNAIIAGGIGLAAFAGLFPWYVFLHQDEFGVQPMTYQSGREMADWPSRSILSASQLAIIGEEGEAAGEFDPLATATVPEEKPEPEEDALDQPFPASSSPFRLLHVANGRALIENRSGMYLVRIGSVLPDNSRLARLEKQDGEWVIVTSEGDVIRR